MSVQSLQSPSATCGQSRLFQREGVNHMLHLLLTLFLFGFWLIPWIIISISHSGTPYRCTTCGQAAPVFAKSGALFTVLVCVFLIFGAVMIVNQHNHQAENPVTVTATTPTPSNAAPAPAAVNTASAPRESAQERAVAKFPDLGRQGSALNIAFLKRYQEYKASRKEFFNDPKWPTKLAQECSQ